MATFRGIWILSINWKNWRHNDVKVRHCVNAGFIVIEGWWGLRSPPLDNRKPKKIYSNNNNNNKTGLNKPKLMLSSLRTMLLTWAIRERGRFAFVCSGMKPFPSSRAAVIHRMRKVNKSVSLITMHGAHKSSQPGFTRLGSIKWCL